MFGIFPELTDPPFVVKTMYGTAKVASLRITSGACALYNRAAAHVFFL